MRKYYFILTVIATTFLTVSLYITTSKLFVNKLEELNDIEQIKLNILFGINKNGIPDEIDSVKTINDPEQITQIVAKLRTYSDNWQYEEFSPPWTGIAGRIAPVQVVFYSHGKVKTFLSIGCYEDDICFLQQSPGPGRYLNHQEFKEVMNFLEIDKKLAYMTDFRQ